MQDKHFKRKNNSLLEFASEESMQKLGEKDIKIIAKNRL